MKRIYKEDDLTGMILQLDMICKKCKGQFSSLANQCEGNKLTMCPHCQHLNKMPILIYKTEGQMILPVRELKEKY